MSLLTLLSVMAAILADLDSGKDSASRRRSSAKALRDRAVRYYGITDDPALTGFLLADGRWLDFSEGGDMRSLDHRNVGHLLPDVEAAKLEIRGDPEPTLVMNEWMNRAEAVRVSLGSNGYGLIDLPDDATATVAVLRDPRLIARWAANASDWDVGWRGRVRQAASPSELGAHLRAIRDQALAEVTRGGGHGQ